MKDLPKELYHLLIQHFDMKFDESFTQRVLNSMLPKKNIMIS